MRRQMIAGAAFGLALLAFSFASQEADVDGAWELRTKIRNDEVVWKVVFKQDGQKLAVTMTGPRGYEISGTGTLNGQTIEWSVTRMTARGEMAFAYQGIVRGDAMIGEVQAGRLGRFEWEAKRASG